MERITTEEKYNEKVEVFRAVYNNESVSLEEKIELCEEFTYCDYVKNNPRIDFAQELAEMYLKAGRYQNVITFINFELKTRFEKDNSWWMFIADMLPQCTFCVIDAYIALMDYQMAKDFLDALKMNRAKMLEMHPNDELTEECKFWYAKVITKYVQICILEGDISSASHYLKDSIFESCKVLEFNYYMGLIFTGDKNSVFKNISLAVSWFTTISDLDTSDGYVEEEINMIVSSNYYLGLIHATENGYKNKEKAISYLTKAKELGYSITDEEIKRLTENIIDSTSSGQAGSSNNNSGGCYVATCVYGSYDCPEVWSLRRFRDNILAENAFGRLFIKLYYAVSPTAVRLFGDYRWFHKMFKALLDSLVEKLINNGIENTPYND